MQPTVHRLLDLTRLMTRAGRGVLTGIDRVELAYLERFLSDPEPASFLVRARQRYLLLGKPAAAVFRDTLLGIAEPGPVDLIGRLSFGLPEPRRRIEADLRRMSGASVRRGRLSALLPRGTSYFNVGHANLTPELLAEIGRVQGANRTILVHDTIPLDHPQFSRPEAVEGFRQKVAAVVSGADRVVCVSRDTMRRVMSLFEGTAWQPVILAAHIGAEPRTPDPKLIPGGLPRSPYFVMVGTIEPRKNHRLVLDVWEAFHRTLPEDRIPQLVIAGSRGWLNSDVFARLDRSSMMGRTVFERPGLPDAAVSALIQGAAGLLFPSRAEGFGLPPLEAAALGTPAVVAPLEVYSETLGDQAIYANPDDVAEWADIVMKLADPGAKRPKPRAVPSWDEHFSLILGKG